MNRPAAPQAVYLKDYQAPAYLLDKVELNFELKPADTRVTANLWVRKNPQSTADASRLRLQGEELHLESLKINDRLLSADEYHCDAHGLDMTPPAEAFRLEIVTRIRPAENTSLEGLYTSSGNFCTQCEAEGFRKITYFLDRPDVMAPYRVTIHAQREKYPVLLSNGNPVASGIHSNGQHWITWEDPFPKPCYLFALVAGDLACIEDHFTTKSGRKITLRIYVQPHNKDKCAHAMYSLKKAMAWDEQVFGLEYDLDIYMIVAVDDFNMGAMENKGLNIFNSRYVLADPTTATDDDFLNIERVIAHEYFHNWTGNRVTCRDWFQLSLKEGLTVFRDQEFSADVGARAVKRIDDVRKLRMYQFPEDAGPLAHPVRPDSYIEINNFYTLTIYEKGAEVIRMLHTLLGPQDFRKGMDLYFERHDGQAVTCDDFVQAMQDASGRDLTHFKRWYTQAGTPIIQSDASYDAAQKSYRLRLRQQTPPTPGQSQKQPLHIPVRMGLLAGNGDPIPVNLRGDNRPAEFERVLDFTEAEQVFEFENVAEKPVASLLRGFSAPVKLETNLDKRQLGFLMAHDQDDFNRWDAGQSLALQVIKQAIQDYQQGQAYKADSIFVAACQELLSDTSADPALLAEALVLPAETYIGDNMASVDVEAIHAARENLRKTLANELADLWLERYQTYALEKEYSIEPDAIGRRRLKNLALSYLLKRDLPEMQSLAEQQFSTANNMTDELAALRALSETGEGAAQLQSFYDKWQHDPLVVDKWLTMNALVPQSETLQRVRELTRHPAFDIRNPNRVRALIGAFCMHNPIAFHLADGGGYEFLAEHVMQLDALNPQVAARLAGGLTQWRRYDSARQALMRAQLERIKAQANLSNDVYEVVSKSLA